MAGNIKGPAIFLAQFAGDAAPFNSFKSICKWAGSLGYKGVQVPTWDGRMMDLKKASESKTYCDELKGTAAKHGITITELSSHLQGHLVVANPAFNDVLDAFAQAAQQAGDTATAILAYKAFLKLAPDDPNAPIVKAQLKQLKQTSSASG